MSFPSTGYDSPYVDEIAERLAWSVGEPFKSADGPTMDRWRTIAEEVVRYIGEDDFHLGCTSAEAAKDDVDQARDEGRREGFAAAKDRVIDGLTRLQNASMVEAEAVVEIVPRIREMDYDDAPVGSTS